MASEQLKILSYPLIGIATGYIRKRVTRRAGFSARYPQSPPSYGEAPHDYLLLTDR